MKIRVICCFLLIFFFSLDFLFSQSDKIAEINNILTLENEALFKALDKFSSEYYFGMFRFNKPVVNSTYTHSDTLSAYWSLIEKITKTEPETSYQGFGATRSLEHILYDIIKVAGKTEYEKLLLYYKELPNDNYYKYDSFLFTLCNGRIQREIDEIIKSRIKAESDFTSSKNHVAPPSLESVPSEIKDKWFLYNSFESYYKYRLDQDTTCDWYYVQKHYDLFIEKIEEILFSETPYQLNELMRFQWGGWCGTGSEFFYEERQIGVLIILLRDRDYPAILGNPDFTVNVGHKNFRKLIELTGYDWIDYFTGAMCAGKFWRVSPEFYWQGGDVAATNLLKMKKYKFKNSYEKQNYLFKCYSFLKKEKKSDYSPPFDLSLNPFYSDEFIDDFGHSVELSNNVKNELLDLIIENVRYETDPEICKDALRILGGLEFNQQIKEVLQLYTKSQFKAVRDGAAKIMRNNGLVVDLQEDDGLIKFRILLDGIPLTNFELGYELEGSSSSFGYYTGNGKTTDQGIFKLNKDELLKLNKDSTRIRFSSNKHTNFEQHEAFFCTDLFIQNNISDTIDVSIKTGRLGLKLNYNRDRDFYKDKQMQIYFSGQHCTLNYVEITNPAQEFYMLPYKIQKGREYYISISVPGSKDWHKFFEINSDTTVLNVKLKYGSKVLFKIQAPGGENADQEVSFELINNSRSDDYFFTPYDYIVEGYESIPAGSYTLKIFSSKEKKARIEANTKNNCTEIIPDYDGYKGKEINFIIDENSSETIDLGLIELESLEE